MVENNLLFADGDTALSELVERALASKPSLPPSLLVDQSRSDGPQKAWEEETAAAHATWDSPRITSGGSTKGDLMSSGSLNMGMNEEVLHELMSDIELERETVCPPPRRAVSRPSALENVFSAVECEDGFKLTGINLHRFADNTGIRRDVVVNVPASIGGTPVTRLGSGCFARLKTRGIAVRAIIVPESVTYIEDGAFSHASVDLIYIGRGVARLGSHPFDMSSASPRSKRRTWSVHPENEAYLRLDRAAQSGCAGIATRDGKRLVCGDAPCEADLRLPDGLEEVDVGAWPQGCPAPSCVRYPPSLRQVESATFDRSLWIGGDAPAVRQLRRRGARIASPLAVHLGEAWYDFDGDEAALVCGPAVGLSVSQKFATNAIRKLEGEHAIVPSAATASGVSRLDGHAKVFAPPRTIEGRTLRRIARNAVQHAAETVTLPPTVRRIEDGNAFKRTRNLSLPEGLEVIGAHCFCSRELEGIVQIPASVRSIGTGSFEYAVCRFAVNGTIVHVPADQLLNCFIGAGSGHGEATLPAGAAPFDFARYDAVLEGGKNIPDRLGALIHRLETPVELSETTKRTLLEKLEGYGDAALVRIAQEGSLAQVAKLYESGFIAGGRFERQIELLRRHNRIDCVMYLMDQHAKDQPKQASSKSRFSL